MRSLNSKSYSVRSSDYFYDAFLNSFLNLTRNESKSSYFPSSLKPWLKWLFCNHCGNYHKHIYDQHQRLPCNRYELGYLLPSLTSVMISISYLILFILSLDYHRLSLYHSFVTCILLYGTKYSGMDEVKFVEDSF